MDLREFVDFPARTILTVTPGQLGPIRDDVREIKELVLDLTIQKSGEEYFCQGKLMGKLVIECSRCLSDFEADLVEPTNFIICSAIRTADKDVIDDEDYAFFKGNDLRVDLTEIIYQALVLSLPMKPLCSETCRGLCPVCGINLNQSECDCPGKVPDTRWEGLKGLLEQ
ncbi:MAG: YceD family protein [Candidatus Zixiibacteriota bacterium]